MTTCQTGGLYQGYSPDNKPAPKDAGFHFVQELLHLTRHKLLKEAYVLFATIPKGIFIFFYTQLI